MPDPDPARATRRLATAMLVGMAGVFAVSAHFGGRAPAWSWLRAFSEAAMVGGLADWFAVSALFRRPLGLPIPHTGLIPANKDRIADSMASFLRENFLTPSVVARRLRALDMAAALGRFLSAPARDGGSRLREGVAQALGEVLRALDDEKLGALIRSGLRGQLEKIELAPLAGQLLGAALAEGRHLPLLEAALHRAGRALEANEALLRAKISEHAGGVMRWTGLDARVASAVLDGLYRLLAECIVDPDHPLRRQMEEGIARLADELMHDAAMQARVARLQAEALANPAMAAWMDRLGASARAALHRAASDPERALAGKLGAGLGNFGEALQSDARLAKVVNRVVRRALVGLANRHGAGIVTLVSETVRRWDARTVSRRIEAIVGRDLQYIRMNGTLVGGLVGVGLHAVERWV